MEEVAEHELVSKEFDAPEEAPKKEKKKYIPPMNHPWRKDSFANYAAKQKHRCGNVIKLRIDSYQGIQTKCMPFLFSLSTEIDNVSKIIKHLNCKMKLELRNWDKGACPFIPIRAAAGPLFSIFL